MKYKFDSAKEITKKTEAVFKSSCICLAKWYHANIYLQTGETHSCYHPPPHAISKEAIATSPQALHNTETKLKERSEMLNGIRPAGCSYCWNIEDMGDSFISDRHTRTGSIYTEKRITEIQNLRENPNVVPDYIEVSFGNECNFRCGYCHPKASSRYYNEIKEHGPYEMVSNHRCDIDWFKIYKEEDNPYLTAWWQWWKKIEDQVSILRVTGGEPLIQKSTAKLLSLIEENPKPKLELDINSNLGSSPLIVQKFFERIQKLTDEKKIKQFRLFSSIDTWGPQAEYIRNGLKLETFEANVLHFLEHTNSPITFMMTFNIFSVVNFGSVLKKILEWRSKYPWNNPRQFHRVSFDISYLKEPLQYDFQILPKEDYLHYMENHLQFIKANLDDTDKTKFTYMEYQNFRRIIEYMKTSPYPEEKIRTGRSDFWKFFKEHDRRRNTDFVAAFPEMEKFIELCKSTAEA